MFIIYRFTACLRNCCIQVKRSVAETKNEIENDEINLNVHITGRGNVKVLFELKEGDQTNHFISELFRLVDNCSKNKRGNGFIWIQPYLTSYPPEMETVGRTKEEAGFLEQTVSLCDMSRKEHQLTLILFSVFRLIRNGHTTTKHRQRRANLHRCQGENDQTVHGFESH